MIAKSVRAWSTWRRVNWSVMPHPARRHERRSHLQVQVRNGNACLEWLPIAFPFAEGPRVRIRLPPARSLVRTGLSGPDPIDDPGHFTNVSAIWTFRLPHCGAWPLRLDGENRLKRPAEIAPMDRRRASRNDIVVNASGCAGPAVCHCHPCLLPSACSQSSRADEHARHHGVGKRVEMAGDGVRRAERPSA
jgi:hypothetical protein